MTISVTRGETDAAVEQLIAALRSYEKEHPTAQIDIYRQDRFSVRIRVIDQAFDRIGLVDRHNLVWDYLDRAPEEAIADISTVLTLSPDEMEKSFASVEFDNPVPSEF